MDSVIASAVAEVANGDFGIDAASLELHPRVRIDGEVIDWPQSVAVLTDKQVNAANQVTEVKRVRTTTLGGAPRCIH